MGVFRKSVTVCLAGAVVFLLAACGSSDGGSVDTGPDDDLPDPILGAADIVRNGSPAHKPDVKRGDQLPSIQGQTLTARHADAKFDDERHFIERDSDDDTRRLVVLTTADTASEDLILAFSPYQEPANISEIMCGKSFSLRTNTTCGQSLAAIKTIRGNAVGVLPMGGKQPLCRVTAINQTTTTDPNDSLTSSSYWRATLRDCLAINAVSEYFLAGSPRSPSFGSAEIIGEWEARFEGMPAASKTHPVGVRS